MRRVFIIRKDLHLKPGKLAAMVSHCAEAYWTNLLRSASVANPVEVSADDNQFTFKVNVNKDIWTQYVCGIFTKTVCEARNRNQLAKAEMLAKEHGLTLGADYGYINDRCLTDLTPENSDGTCTVGIWFKPLPDDVAHAISKKFQLYRDEHAV